MEWDYLRLKEDLIEYLELNYIYYTDYELKEERLLETAKKVHLNLDRYIKFPDLQNKGD